MKVTPTTPTDLPMSNLVSALLPLLLKTLFDIWRLSLPFTLFSQIAHVLSACAVPFTMLTYEYASLPDFFVVDFAVVIAFDSV